MIKRILKNESGVSPVLGFILILAIGVSLITNMQINSVPVWNMQEDLDHLEKMTNDINQLKSNIDNSFFLGSSMTSPLIMGFKYSPKGIFYNPREVAMVTLDIKNDTWAEVRYNEIIPDGIDDATSIKTLSTLSLSYSLQSTKAINPFLYEHGLVWRSGYTKDEQSIVSNDVIKLLSLTGEDQTLRESGKRTINLYSISPNKNSVIGSNVWFRLHTKNADWWANRIRENGGLVRINDQTKEQVTAYFDRRIINLGKSQINVRSQASPSSQKPFRLVKVPIENDYLNVGSTSTISVEVQDIYNNPVSNVRVNFSINTTTIPANANQINALIQSYAYSGVDGRASVQLNIKNPKIHYIDVSIQNPQITATFDYPANTQSPSLSFDINDTNNRLEINATYIKVDGLEDNKMIVYESNYGIFTKIDNVPIIPAEKDSGQLIYLNYSNDNALRITDINVANESMFSAEIKWKTNNVITLTGFFERTTFHTEDIDVDVDSTGNCVRYGTSPGNYPYIQCDNVTDSSHSVTLTGLTPSTEYFFIVNSSRPGGASVNSTEYMFVSDVPPDVIPPASITGLTSTSGLLYINWTWQDPADADFDHVVLYVDDKTPTTVPKGQQYYNANYFMPNTTHNIRIRTLDNYSNANATWINDTASTSTVLTYVFNISENTFGNVNNFDNAKSDSDGNASANLIKEALYTYLNNRTTNPTKQTTGTQSGSYTPSNLTSSDGAIDITIPS